MEIKTHDYSMDIESLEKMFNSLQQNVFFTITLSLSVIALSIAIAGWALYFLAKQWVDIRVEKEYEKIDERIKRLISENRMVYYANGNISVQSGNKITLTGLLDFSPEKFINVVVYDYRGEVIQCVAEEITKDRIIIKLNNEVNGYTSFNWNLFWRK